MPELQQLDAGHAPAVLAFELANRAYFAAYISDRGDEFFDQFTEQHSAMLAEQEAGTGAFYVLVAEDGSVLGRFNLYRFNNGTAELGYRVAQHVAGRGVATAAVQELAGWRGRGIGCAHSGRPPPGRTRRPRRCWPRPGSFRSARQTRLTSAVRKAPGISVTWPPADPDQPPAT